MTKFSASAFMLLICTAALLSTTGGVPRQHGRCECIKTHSVPAIPQHRVKSLRVNPSGSHCNREEIIVTMKKGVMCLDPTKDWVISLKAKFYKNGVKIQKSMNNTVQRATEEN